MPPSYYDELLALGDFKVSLTTNLKDFILDPDKWMPVLSNKRVGVATSFQYGDGRQYAPGVPYDEQMFRLVMDEFKDRIGYVPSFISVISEDNAERALDHLRLAKDLGTKCKLNGCLDLGKSKSTFPFYRMVDIWLEA